VSGATRAGSLRTRAGGLRSGHSTERLAALAGSLLLIASYAGVLYHVGDVVGRSWQIAAALLGALGLATALARALSVRRATLLSAGLFGGGLFLYLLSVPSSQLALLTFRRVAGDTVALLTGMSVLRLTNAGVWALAILPGPTFLSWYLALRGQTVRSVLVGGAALGTFVLTGDAGTAATLIGVGGAAVAVGFSALDRRSTTAAQRETLLVVVAAMIVLSASVSVVPGGEASPLFAEGPGTVEANLVSAGDRLGVVGSISLSPEVRFTVRGEQGA
jgi:hypothetical protein